MTDVKPRQVWADNDVRSRGRTVEVVSVDATHATVKVLTARTAAPPQERERAVGRQTRIRLNRFRPNNTGYVLVADAD